MDILLIFPPISIEERYRRKVGKKVGGHLPPIGLASLAAYIREKGFSVGILDCPALEYSEKEILQYIQANNPKVIGISVLTPTYHRAVQIARTIKQNNPEKLILLGGPHATLMYSEIVNHSCFDFIIIGEGELTLEDLMKIFKKNNYNKKEIMKDKNLDMINGIAYKLKNVRISNPRLFIQNLDELPFPAVDLLPMHKYMPLPLNYKKLPIIHMVTSRGCCFNCTYCSESVLSGNKIRKQSPDRVIKEVEHLKKEYGIKEVAFWDDAFTMNRAWIIEFCEKLIKKNIDLTWTCYSRINTVDIEMLKKMKLAGCWNIFYGIEAGSETLLRNINKKINLDQIRQAVHWTKQAGIEVRASFMLALPGETPELANQTIDFAIELDPDYAQFCITTPYPGTELYNTIDKWGRLDNDFKLYSMWNPVFVPFGYHSKAEIICMEKKAMRRFYIRPRFIIKKILKIRSFEDLLRQLKGVRILLGFV